MNFSNFHSFLEMGGYAGYVWSAYGVVTAMIIVNVAAPLLKMRRLKHENKHAS